MPKTFTVEFEREDDGRGLAEVLELPGVLAYGQTSDEAIAKAQALAWRSGRSARTSTSLSWFRWEESDK